MYRAAGELAFMEQDLGLAMEMMSRSLDQRDTSDVRRRLESIRNSVLAKKEDAHPAESAKASEVVVVAGANARRGKSSIVCKGPRKRGICFQRLKTAFACLKNSLVGPQRKWAGDRILEIY
jgi:hypothetical protein